DAEDAGEQLEQGRFAGAVGADEAGLVAARDRRAGAFEQGAACDSVGHIGDLEHGRPLIMGGVQAPIAALYNHAMTIANTSGEPRGARDGAPAGAPPESSVAVACLLSLSGGFLDAFTYIGHGGVFANAMTGNVVLMGVKG